MHFAAPILAVLATLGATVEAQRAVCNRRQYADVANQIQNPAYFCKFYLKQSRKSSPLRKYGARSLTQLCKCFVQNSPRVQGPFEPLRPNPAPKTCPINLYRALRNQYKDPAYFCRWYTSVPRTLSPLPSQANPRVVEKACRCFLNEQFAPQKSTTTRRTTPVATTTEEPTDTSSTDEPVPTTTTTDIVGPIGGTRTTTTTTSRETTSTLSSTIGLPTLVTLTTSTTAAGETTPAADTTSFTSTVTGTVSSTSSSSSGAPS